MYIVAIAWIYVVLMMAVTENSVTAGVMTFLFYGALPVMIILYLMGTPQRKRNRRREKELAMTTSPPEQTEIPANDGPTGQNVSETIPK